MFLGVVMPVVNQFELGVKALESIKSKHLWTPFIAANWRNRVCVAEAWNNGIYNFPDAKYVLIINDDIVLAPHTIDHMVDMMEENGELAVLSATDYRNTESPESVREMGEFHVERDLIDAPDFSCFMIRVEAFGEIGPFDTNFEKAYFEDDDYVRRIVVNDKWDVRRSQRAMFYHYGSRTQNAGGKKAVTDTEFRNNRAYYVSKWGGMPGEENYQIPFTGNAVVSKVTLPT